MKVSTELPYFKVSTDSRAEPQRNRKKYVVHVQCFCWFFNLRIMLNKNYYRAQSKSPGGELINVYAGGDHVRPFSQTPKYVDQIFKDPKYVDQIFGNPQNLCGPFFFQKIAFY